CIAAVTAGTFQYRSSRGAAVFVPGALLLGEYGTCFECGHEHAAGDRCLAFHYAPEHFEAVVASVPGVRRMSFLSPCLPPMPQFARLFAESEAARDAGDAAAFEELAFRLAGAVVATQSGASRPSRAPNAEDVRRVTASVRRIEASVEQGSTLTALAREVAMSPYHFLRVFRSVVGMTPYQFVLHTRLHRAAVQLRCSDEPVSAIAFDVGFNDLSTFNRRFRSVMGATPSAYRADFRGESRREGRGG
ncbi:MAG: helix-turn-helix transcriptional regulator, partial [Rhodospirillales bacterium]|nr:helix-turn-helix transcriptional regulator [Rhodospirillales bacterium]